MFYRLSLVLVLLTLFINNPVYAAQKSWKDVADEVSITLQQANEAYIKGDVEQANFFVDEAYFGPYEGAQMEKTVRLNISAKANAEIEGKFRKLKKAFSTKEDINEIGLLIDDINQTVFKAAKQLDGEQKTGFGVFLASLMIIVREGFEAILILGAIIAYLIKTGNKSKVKTIYGGLIFALVASVVTAVVIKYLFKISGASQEILEGVTMILAVVVLFSMSFWLISKVEAKKWKDYIEGKVKESLGKGNTVALWLAAFLAVYREGAETVLFYIAMFSGAEQSETNMITLGMLVGSIILIALFVIVRYGSVKIPLKPFFLGTSLLMFYLAFVFSGQGINELQAAGALSITSINMPTFSVLGIYPTLESLVAQGTLIMTASLMFIYKKLKQTANI